jgi:hypothetical protein
MKPQMLLAIVLALLASSSGGAQSFLDGGKDRRGR